MARKTEATETVEITTTDNTEIKENAEMNSADIKNTIEAGIDRAVDELLPESSHFRYKAMRALAYQAFVESIERGEFEELIENAIVAAPDLPRGWTVNAIRRNPEGVGEEVKEEEVKEEPKKAAPKKAAPKKAAPRKTTARKPRQTRKAPAKVADPEFSDEEVEARAEEEVVEEKPAKPARKPRTPRRHTTTA